MTIELTQEMYDAAQDEVAYMLQTDEIRSDFRNALEALLAVVNRMRSAQVDSLLVRLGERARNEARLMNALDAVKALTKDTDGGDVDGDADIPVGEIRRVLAEAGA